MKNIISQVQALLERDAVTFEPLSADDRDMVVKRWLQVYARNVKQQTGAWVHNSFKWHGFSHGYEAATEGEQALRAYQSQWSASYVIFDEDESWALACASQAYPDLSALGADLYVAHHNMKWTMVFTHEQPQDGPFFAEQGR